MRRAWALGLVLTAALAAADPAAATFPGRNGRIAYVPNPATAPTPGIWTMRPTGSFRRPLLRSPWVNEPAWSPGGDRLALTHTHVVRAFDADVYADDLYTLRADGTGLRRLTRTRGPEAAPSWSPDGRRLAYIRWSSRVYAAAVWTMRADGTKPRRLTPAGAGDAEWSPDGERIAYSGPDGGLLVIDLATRAVRRISPAGEGEVSHVSWSPDGEWIAFEQGSEGAALIRPDGTGHRPLGSTGDPRPEQPLWSPDGRSISYCRWDPARGTYDRWTMRPDGGGRRFMWASSCHGASWQPRVGAP